MDINHIASGSSGNCIIVGDGETRLLLDAGISYKKIARWIRPTSLAGVLITHEHGDHSKAVPELLRRGVEVWMSDGTRKEIRPSSGYIPYLIEHKSQVEIGSWIVLPFDVKHDAAEPLGFLFQSKVTGEKGVYIADSAYVNYNFTGVTHWIIEANYSEEILESGQYEDWLKDRVRQSHFSFDDLCRFLDDSDLSATEEIHLVHLSNANSNEQEFKDKLQKRYGVPVFTISDSKQPKTKV